MTSVTESDIICNALNGIPKRRVIVLIEGEPASNAHAADLTTYDSRIGSIEGVIENTYDNVTSSTATTWSATTVTFVGGATTCKIGLICTLT